MEDTSIISIGMQLNGPEHCPLSKLKVSLYKCLEANCKSSYSNLVDQYSCVLRVGGSLGDFSPEQTHKFKINNKSRYITCDIDIPQNIWKVMSEVELRDYLSDKVRLALVDHVERLKKKKDQINEKKLFEEIDFSIKVYKEKNS